MSEPDTTHGSPDDVVVVRESSVQREGLYGFLTVALLAALVRGVRGASTTGGGIAAGVVLGVVVAIIVAGWVRALRKPDRLEVSSAALRYVMASGKPTRELSRRDGADLRFVARRAGRLAFPALCQTATSATMPLRMFSRRQVRRACESRGWRFASATTPARPTR